MTMPDLMYAQLLAAEGELAAAQAQLGLLSAAAKNDPEVQAMSAQIKASVEANRPPPRPDLEAAIASNPANLQARLELADHHVSFKSWEEALEQLLEIVQRDRKFGDDVGRKKMIEVFGMASAQPELVVAWRRKLSSALN